MNDQAIKQLLLPIKFYQQPRMRMYIVILLFLLFISYGYDAVYPIPNHRGELPNFIKILVSFISFIVMVLLLKQSRNPQPIFLFDKQGVLITQWFKDDIFIPYRNIKAIHVNHGRHARMGFELYNQKLFENQPTLPLGFLEVEKIKINSRQIEDIANQVFQNAHKGVEMPIFLHRIKQKFFDGF